MAENINNEVIEQQGNKNDIQISDIISWTLKHKMFIALSVLICLLLGIIYVYRSQPVFQRESSVMIRTSQQGNAEIGELAAFSDLGIFNTGIDVFNEIEAFRSPTLMERIVKRLGLNTIYTSKNWIGRVTDWYDKTPLKADFSKINESYNGETINSVSVKIDTDDNGKTFIFHDFKINGKDVDSNKITAPAGKPVETPAGIITVSPTLLFGNNYNGTITATNVSVKEMAKKCLKNLTAELADKKATVINFSYTDTSAKRAEDVLNTLLDVYNEDWVSYMSESAANTSKFIDERLVVIEHELNLADSDIERFKSDNKLLDVTLETAQVTQESSKYSDESFKINNQLTIAQYIREYLTDQTKALELLPSNSGIENDNVEQQISEYNKMLLERQRLVDNSSDKNPLVADLNNQLTMMRSTIQRSIDNLISTLKIQADRLSAQEDKIAGQIVSNPGKVRELLGIERQQKIKEQLYLYLLQKREENELSASIVVNNTRLLKPATGQNTPISPNKMMILAAAIILGIAIPYGYMFLSNMMDTTVRGRKDVEELDVPILGEIPQNGKVRRISRLRNMLMKDPDLDKAPEIVVKPHSRNVINEAYRVVRTNIDFMIGSTAGSQAIMVTSYNPGSGKSFTTSNLAASMALKKKSVVIVDLDIRKATLSKIISKKSGGVTSYLNGQSGIEDIIVKNGTSIEGIDIVPVGIIPPNPSELLLTDRLAQMINELKTRYDYVFIDCPPFGIIADTSIIARVADRTIFVIRVGRFDRRALPEISEIYKNKQLPNMSILVNGSHQNTSYGYSRYGYGYGYGYGYEHRGGVNNILHYSYLAGKEDQEE